MRIGGNRLVNHVKITHGATIWCNLVVMNKDQTKEPGGNRDSLKLPHK
jgi:hypothetical protein